MTELTRELEAARLGLERILSMTHHGNTKRQIVAQLVMRDGLSIEQAQACFAAACKTGHVVWKRPRWLAVYRAGVWECDETSVMLTNFHERDLSDVKLIALARQRAKGNTDIGPRGRFAVRKVSGR